MYSYGISSTRLMSIMSQSQHESMEKCRFYNPPPSAHGPGLSCSLVMTLGLHFSISKRETLVPSSPCCCVDQYLKALCRVPTISQMPNKQVFPALLCKLFVSFHGCFPTALRNSQDHLAGLALVMSGETLGSSVIC